MKTIIAPTDFSDISLNAVNYAADMAQDINGELVLVHADSYFAAVADSPFTPRMANTEEFGAQQLNNFREKLVERTKNKINIRMQNVKGNAFSEIEKICVREHPFLTVIATHSPSVIERWLTPSVTLHAAEHFQCPVLVVPDKSSYKGIKNIGLACELKHIYEEPAGVLQAFIRTFHASLHLLHVVRPGEDKRFIEMMLTRHRFHEFDPALHFIEKENIYGELFSFVKKNAFDILIIIHHQHTSSEQPAFKKLVLHPQIPIMVLQQVL